MRKERTRTIANLASAVVLLAILAMGLAYVNAGMPRSTGRRSHAENTTSPSRRSQRSTTTSTASQARNSLGLLAFTLPATTSPTRCTARTTTSNAARRPWRQVISVPSDDCELCHGSGVVPVTSDPILHMPCPHTF